MFTSFTENLYRNSSQSKLKSTSLPLRFSSHLRTNEVAYTPLAEVKDTFEKKNSTSNSYYNLFKLQEVEGLSDVEKKTRSIILGWCENFLSKPNSQLGHPNLKRPVCPFTPRALNNNTIWLAVDPNPCPSPQKTEEALLELSENFDKIEPLDNKSKMTKTIIIAFPNLPLSEVHSAIDKIQHKVKPSFVKNGLMIGEFHLNNQNHGSYNRDFYPFQTPIPAFNIRPMVAEDLHFLSDRKYSPKERIFFIRSYLAQNFRANKKQAIEELMQAYGDMQPASFSNDNSGRDMSLLLNFDRLIANSAKFFALTNSRFKLSMQHQS